MLSPETIRLMAQTYEEWMQDPATLSRPLETMQWAYQHICAGEDPWTGLGSFSHAWYGYAKDRRAALVTEPLIGQNRTPSRPAVGVPSVPHPSSSCVITTISLAPIGF